MLVKLCPLRLPRDARGGVAVLLALALTVLSGFAALGIETGLWYAVERQQQSAADAAALAGAYEVAAGSTIGTYSDICTQAQRAATANDTAFASYTCPGTSPNCTSPSAGDMCVNNPPVSDSTDNQAVEVYLAQQQKTFLAKLFKSSVTIGTHAIAKVTQVGLTCDLALGKTGTDIAVQGSASINLTGCGMAANSTSGSSISFGGGKNDVLDASWFQTAGNYRSSGSPQINVPTQLTNAAPVTDPYSCNPPTLGCAGKVTYSWPTTSLGCSTGGATLQPGLYGGNKGTCKNGTGTGGLPLSFTSGTTTLCPGVYYLDGEDNQGEAFLVKGNATVKMGTAGSGGCPANGMSGVTLIASSQSGTKGGGFQIQGGTVTLSAPTAKYPSGCTLGSTPCMPSGILFYQDPAHADTSKSGSGYTGDSLVTASSSNTIVTGAMYTPATNVKFTGNANSTCFIVISLTMTYIGNSTMSGNSSACTAVGVSAPTVLNIALTQ
jgi:Flp pilus assembly protein TadG